MNLHSLQTKTQRSMSNRIGRGGKRGKTSGRGVKGQRAHGDHGVRPDLRDAIKKLPKRRGYGKNRARTHVYRLSHPVISLARLQNLFDTGATINPLALVEKKVVSMREATTRDIKILGNGNLEKKFTLEGCVVSATTRAKIEKAGGKVL